MRWISLEGTDGSGKTTLARKLRDLDLPDTTVLLRDDNPEQSLPLSVSARTRVNALRSQVWGYDHAEPVTDYGKRYWLYALGSWFWLYFETIISAADQSEFVITDGWALKHWARFRLHTDTRLRAAADLLFAELPWPDHLVLLPAVNEAAASAIAKPIKPSETGAFDRTGPTGFSSYQSASQAMLQELAEEIDDDMADVRLSRGSELQDVLDVLQRIGLGS